MPITLFTGRPGSGKSLMMADTMVAILRRNKKWREKSGESRVVYSNLRLSKQIEDQYEGLIEYWDDPAQLIKLRDCDVFWDEIATHLDAMQYKETPLDLKRWLQQHRKLGIEIYGTTQDFAMIDISMRRMTSEIYLLRKLIGSRDPSPTRPAVKFVWGLVLVRQISPTDYQENMKELKSYGLDFFLITRARTEVFDTRQEIKLGVYPPLQHVLRACGDPRCNYERVLHF